MVGHAASQWQIGRSMLGLSIALQGPAEGSVSREVGHAQSGAEDRLGAGAPASLPRPQPVALLLFQEAILISLAALQPGLTQAGAQPSGSFCQAQD